MKFIKPIISILLILAVFGTVIFFGEDIRESGFVQDMIAQYSYAGVFLISFLSGINFIVPIPAISFFPLFTAAGLNAVITVLVITIGLTLADSVSYFFGMAGRNIVLSERQAKVARKLERLRERYKFLPIFILFLFASFVPFPNEVLIVPLAFLGYQLRHIVPAVFSGNLVFNTLSAVGLINLTRFF